MAALKPQLNTLVVGQTFTLRKRGLKPVLRELRSAAAGNTPPTVTSINPPT
jgi:hypothetical protein